MDYRLTQEEEAFKEEFREWLEDHIPEGFLSLTYPLPESWDERVKLYKDFQNKLFDAGYAGITYPKKYGGRGGSIMEQVIVTEALAPWLMKTGDVGVIGKGTVGPTILACGSEDQKKTFLPKLLKGEHIWCQGFSEPDAGSDLSSILTLAKKDDDDYIINGQKIWTTMGHVADYCMLLVKTNLDVPPHKGMSYFILDTKLPGVTIRPIIQMTGEIEFNEVFLDDVRVPGNMMIGEEGQGWKLALTTLGFERTMGDISIASGYWWQYERLVEMSRKVHKDEKPASEDPVIRQKLAECFIDLMVVRQVGYRSVSKLAQGGVPGPEGSIGKLFWSELYGRINALAMDIQGPYSQISKGASRTIDSGWWQKEFLHSRAPTIAGGTSEIQRNIIAERILGLPRDPK